MRFFIVFFVITLFIIDGVQNAPIIRPVHVQTVPLRPVTVRPTFAHLTTGRSIVPSVTTIRSSKFTSRFSSPSSSTRSHHSSWWNNPHSAGQIILRFVMYATLITIVCKVLDNLCKSKKQQKPCKKENSDVTKDKTCISTIDGKREESPPSYAEIHTV
jgi:hypothetical protein